MSVRRPLGPGPVLRLEGERAAASARLLPAERGEQGEVRPVAPARGGRRILGTGRLEGEHQAVVDGKQPRTL